MIVCLRLRALHANLCIVLQHRLCFVLFHFNLHIYCTYCAHYRGNLLFINAHTHTHTKKKRNRHGVFLVFDMADPDPEACATEDVVWGGCGCVYTCMVGGYRGVTRVRATTEPRE